MSHIPLSDGVPGILGPMQRHPETAQHMLGHATSPKTVTERAWSQNEGAPLHESDLVTYDRTAES